VKIQKIKKILLSNTVIAKKNDFATELKISAGRVPAFVVSGHYKFHTAEAYTSCNLTRVTYNINKLLKVENKYFIVRIKPSILNDCEKI